jgi:hypothetical protein
MILQVTPQWNLWDLKPLVLWGREKMFGEPEQDIYCGSGTIMGE